MNIMNSKFVGKAAIFWKKHGSKICFGAGMAGMVGSGVLCAKGYHRSKLILDARAKDIEEINKAYEEKRVIVKDGVERVYSAEDRDQDLKATKKDAAIGIAKAMGPGIALGLASAGMATAGFVKECNHSKSLAAYALSVEGANRALRAELGEEKVKLLCTGNTVETVEKETVDPETGEKKVTLEDEVKKIAEVPEDGVFIFKFKRGCKEWTAGRRDMNLTKVDFIKRKLTDILVERGFVFGEDINDAIGTPGYERSGAEQVCGQYYKNDPNADNHIALEVSPYDDPQSDEITLIFHSDGLILEKIDEERKKYALKGGKREYVRY